MALAPYADPVTAVVGYLLAQTDLNDFCKGRIFGGELPKKMVDAIHQEPGPAIVVEFAGTTSLDPDTVKLTYPRLQIRLIGSEFVEVGQLYGEVYRLLNGQNSLIQDNIRVLSIVLGGPFAFRDPDVNLPTAVVFASVISQRELVV